MIRTIIVYDRAKLLRVLAMGLQEEYPNHVIYTHDLETAQTAVRQKAIDSPSSGIALIVTLPEIEQVPGDYMDFETFARIKPGLTIIIVITPKVQAMIQRTGKYDQGFGSQYLTLPITTKAVLDIFDHIT